MSESTADFSAFKIGDNPTPLILRAKAHAESLNANPPAFSHTLWISAKGPRAQEFLQALSKSRNTIFAKEPIERSPSNFTEGCWELRVELDKNLRGAAAISSEALQSSALERVAGYFANNPLQLSGSKSLSLTPVETKMTEDQWGALDMSGRVVVRKQVNIPANPSVFNALKKGLAEQGISVTLPQLVAAVTAANKSLGAQVAIG